MRESNKSKFNITKLILPLGRGGTTDFLADSEKLPTFFFCPLGLGEGAFVPKEKPNKFWKSLARTGERRMKHISFSITNTEMRHQNRNE